MSNYLNDYNKRMTGIDTTRTTLDELFPKTPSTYEILFPETPSTLDEIMSDFDFDW